MLSDQFYRFVDRDMMMRFRGGGVGHKSVQKATDYFLQDRFPDDNVDLNIEDDEDVEGVEELSEELGSTENMADEIDEEVSDDEDDEENDVENDEEDEEADSDAEDDGSDGGYAEL